MGYASVGFRSLGAGLNLTDKADAVSEAEAIDCLNVEFTRTGSVKQRDGYAIFTAAELDGQGDTIHPHYESDGTCHLIVGDTATGQLTALLGADGTEQDIEASLSNGGCFGFQRFGAPGTEYTYIGNGVDELWYYNGSAFTNVPDDGARIPPKGGALALSVGDAGTTSNRLVCSRFTTTTGGPNGLTTTPSTIWFSEPGDPTTWDDRNTLDLDPGDGEAIQALVNWGGYLFAFKQTKFYVFYGESVDSVTGNVRFNYRTVNTGHGAIGPRAVAVGESGVYFWDRQSGLMLTQGGEPAGLSESIRPIFQRDAADYFTGGELDYSVASLIAVNVFNDQVYVNYSTGGTANDRTLIYDTANEWWSLWDVAAADMASFHTAATTADQLFFTYATGANQVARFSSAYTNDAGSAITSYWRSGWFDYDGPSVKRIRQSKVWGSGLVQMSVSDDFKLGVGSYTELDFRDNASTTWGGSTWGGGSWASQPILRPVIRRRAVRGTVFSTYFYNDTLDQTWAIHRAEHHLIGTRPPAIRDTE